MGEKGHLQIDCSDLGFENGEMSKMEHSQVRSRSVLGMWNPEALSAANISPLKTLEKIIIFFTGTKWKVINS